jgi:sugar phosphate isomerase/epimerase
VAASGSLAGHYAEEMADNCRDSGLNALELDGLQGKSLAMLGPEAVAKALARLRESGCRVVSLRAPAAGEGVWDLFQLARDAGVPRVVLPFSDRSLGHAVMARETGVTVSFCNRGVDSEIVSGILLRLRTEGLAAGFTFNAAEFARAGELPFLGSYKKKLRRFVDQLDLEDALYDGSPRALGQGNAEIKEMVSILSAASFSGTVVLGPGNRAVGSLLEATRRFEYLLDTMGG